MNISCRSLRTEHLGLALALNVPVFIVITKVDMCPANILQETIKQLIKLLKSPGCRKTVHFIESMDDVFECASSLAREKCALPSNSSWLLIRLGVA